MLFCEQVSPKSSRFFTGSPRKKEFRYLEDCSVSDERMKEFLYVELCSVKNENSKDFPYKLGTGC